jgi:prephenate dehydratase
VLAKIANGNVNLSKLQSMPIPGSNFKYGFYADLEFDQQKQIEKVLEEVKGLTNNMKVFGLYKKGKVVKG